MANNADADFSAERFLQETTANNLFVSQSAQLAQTDSPDPRVRSLAQGMDDRRSAFTRHLRGVVDTFSWRMIVREGSLGAFQTQLPKLIFAAQQGEFDRAYLQSQVDASTALKASLDMFIEHGASTPRLGHSIVAKLRQHARDATQGVADDLRAARLLLANLAGAR
jgi:predicted outer membrane protein